MTGGAESPSAAVRSGGGEATAATGSGGEVAPTNRPREEFGEAARRLHRLSGIPFRLEVEGDGDAARVVHDSLGGEGAGEVEALSLTDGAEVRGRLTVPRRAAGSEEVELLRAILSREAALEAETRLFVRELAERYEEIALLTSISETLGSVIELDRAAEIILQEVVEVTGAARASQWLYEAEDDELVLLASRGRTDPAVRRISVDDRDSMVAAVFRRQEAVLAEPDGGNLVGELRRTWSGYGGAPLLAVPVTYSPPEGERRRVGVLGLVGRRDGSRFTAGDRKLMTVVASQVGAAVETGRLVRESLRRERLATELGLAHDLQLKLLPSPASVADLAPVAARSEPAESVGGDFYHLLRLPGDRLGVMLGDVSSHGISASLIMAQAMSAAGIVAREEECPADVVGRIEEELRRELASTEMYVTLFFGVVDPGERRLRYASAGHPHAFLCGGGTERRLEALDLPLGMGPGDGYQESEVEVPGEEAMLVAFTDGLFEPAAGAWREAEERLVRAAADAAPAGADAVVEALFRSAKGGRHADWDDRTVVAVEI